MVLRRATCRGKKGAHRTTIARSDEEVHCSRRKCTAADCILRLQLWLCIVYIVYTARTVCGWGAIVTVVERFSRPSSGAWWKKNFSFQRCNSRCGFMVINYISLVCVRLCFTIEWCDQGFTLGPFRRSVWRCYTTRLIIFDYFAASL